MFKNSIQKLTRQRLFVTMKPGCGYDLEGVLLHSDKSRDGQHVLADVLVHIPGGAPEKAVGEVYVERVDVAYVQNLPPKKSLPDVNR